MRAPKDVDSLQIKGNNKDFKDLVNDKLGRESRNNMNEENVEEDEEISANDFKKAEPLIPVLTHDIVKKIFSKYWRNKEEAMKILNGEVQQYPGSDLLGQQQTDKLIVSIVSACSYVLQCNVSQAPMAAMDLLKVTLNKFRGTTIQGYSRQELNNAVDQCLISMLEKVGDSNLKLKERAENTVLEFANSRLIGHKLVMEHLVSGQVKKSLLNSAKHLSGRLNLTSRMIENFGLNLDEIPIDTLMTSAISGYKNPNKEVRDAAYNLIMNIYRYMGDGIRSFFKDLRPAQLNLLEEGFENTDGVNGHPANNNNQSNDDNEEFNNESQMMYDEPKPSTNSKGGRQSSSNMKKIESKISQIEQQEGNDIAYYIDYNSNPSDNKLNQGNEASCHLCGAFDPNFDEETILMHYYKECPMVK
jgi:hypothetical protein